MIFAHAETKYNVSSKVHKNSLKSANFAMIIFVMIEVGKMRTVSAASMAVCPCFLCSPGLDKPCRDNARLGEVAATRGKQQHTQITHLVFGLSSVNNLQPTRRLSVRQKVYQTILLIVVRGGH